VAKGEKITITRDGVPVAALMSPQDVAFKLALDKANRTLSQALKNWRNEIL
jgi:antitoxin (DNA-binding transcriptional repressor) of toxin-antitoxin stability system